MDELDNIIELTDEDGNSVKFEFVDLIEYREKEYVVLLPLEDADSGNIVILQVEPHDDDTESYLSIDDEDVLIGVFEIFKDKFKDEFTFED